MAGCQLRLPDSQAASFGSVFRTPNPGRGTRGWHAPCDPNAPYRKPLHPFDAEAHKRRNLVERAICRLKDFRRIATR